MIESKGWDWKDVNGDSKNYWLTPSVESFYLLHRWKDNGYTRFLDHGCGLGRHSILFGQNGFDVFAFDISGDAIKKTKKRAEEMNMTFNYKIGDMLSLPYADESIDCIFCKNVISHSDTNGVKQAISELLRVLKPDGECYLTLGSKASENFKRNWPSIDENTTFLMNEGPEYKVPHFYADYELIKNLFFAFKILSVYHVEDFYEIDGIVRSSYHYHVLVRKDIR